MTLCQALAAALKPATTEASGGVPALATGDGDVAAMRVTAASGITLAGYCGCDASGDHADFWLSLVEDTVAATVSLKVVPDLPGPLVEKPKGYCCRQLEPSTGQSVASAHYDKNQAAEATSQPWARKLPASSSTLGDVHEARAAVNVWDICTNAKLDADGGRPLPGNCVCLARPRKARAYEFSISLSQKALQRRTTSEAKLPQRRRQYVSVRVAMHCVRGGRVAGGLV